MPARFERTYTGLMEGARVFVLLAVAVAVLWGRDVEAIGGLVSLAIVWVGASWFTRMGTPIALVCLGEALLISVIAGMTYDSAPTLLAALCVPPFVYGLARGFTGVAWTLGLQVLAVVIIIGVRQSTPHTDQITEVLTWLMTGLGLGLVAGFLRTLTPPDDGTAAYREARLLLAELNDLAGQLQGGLDPTSMGGALLERVSNALPVEMAIVHVQREGVLLPLVSRASEESLPPEDHLEVATATWSAGAALVQGRAFGIPLMTSGTPIAVVTGQLSKDAPAEPTRLVATLESLALDLAPAALQLDTAQMFAAFRDAAMADERRRLAREMHDGVAQDIASMGYVVDALAASATSPAQQQALGQLRDMITRVVGEVRRSVMTLRTQAGSSESLGAAIATLARHLSDVSGIPIQVTAEERTSRLRHEMEAELLRIAQEAMNNAVKHSQASHIDVHCVVDAPDATIVISDDGRGLQARRRDSHGLSIMRERAALIGGTLDVVSRPDHGTRVTVHVGQRTGSSESLSQPSHNHRS